MLDLLHIENIAVIEQADIEFGRGLNVLTGETGAGKSIIIDAIGAILGGRTSKELVRTGAQSALISAELNISAPAEEWLQNEGISFEQGEEMIISRRITSEGKTACRINGVPVSTAQLRALGDILFDVHGQNDGRRLLSEANHCDYLDAFGGLSSLSKSFREEYSRYTALHHELDDARKAEADREYREERLRREIRELEDAEPIPGEEETLRSRETILRNQEKLRDKLERVFTCFHGNDDDEGIVSLSLTAEASAEQAARYADSLSELAKNIGDFRYRAEDLSDQLRDALRELEGSPGELDHIEERLAVYRRLIRRYGSIEAAVSRLQEAKNELDDVESLSERMEMLSSELEHTKETLLNTGKQLSLGRHKAAVGLCAAVERELGELSMPGARFQVRFTPKSGEGFDSGGMEDVCFFITANAGEELGRLSRIASGGELSRIMLALKNVLRSGGEDVLVFDEIDTGVSGIAAQRVGEKLALLATDRQVLCVTHLPQIAAMADTQFSIVKTQHDGRTYTKICLLDDSGRQQELARLIGGETITDSTLRGAGELIDAARKYKTEIRKR